MRIIDDAAGRPVIGVVLVGAVESTYAFLYNAAGCVVRTMTYSQSRARYAETLDDEIRIAACRTHYAP